MDTIIFLLIILEALILINPNIQIFNSKNYSNMIIDSNKITCLPSSYISFHYWFAHLYPIGIMLLSYINDAKINLIGLRVVIISGMLKLFPKLLTTDIYKITQFDFNIHDRLPASISALMIYFSFYLFLSEQYNPLLYIHDLGLNSLMVYIITTYSLVKPFSMKFFLLSASSFLELITSPILFYYQDRLNDNTKNRIFFSYLYLASLIPMKSMINRDFNHSRELSYNLSVGYSKSLLYLFPMLSAYNLYKLIEENI